MRNRHTIFYPLWILVTTFYNFLLLSDIFVPCYCTTSSHSLRHRQHSTSGGRLSLPDDIELQVWSNITTDVVTTPQPVQVTVRLREDARLPCDIQHNGTRYDPIWRHKGSTVDAIKIASSSLDSIGALGHRYIKDAVSGQLSIANVRLEDDGVWQCEDRETENGAMLYRGRPVHLMVIEPPQAPYLAVDGRLLDPGNVFLPVKEGAELSIWCLVDGGHPAPTLTWLLGGLEVNTSSSDGTISQHTRAEVRLGPVIRDHHNVTISCVVSHLALPSALNVSLLLDVQYSPSFMIGRVPDFGIPLIEGIPVSLKCDVDSNPPSSPIWVKDDGPPPVAQSGDGFLNFSAIRREHSGWYKCSCHHLLGEFSSLGYFLNVREEAEVTQDPGLALGQQVEVALGGAVQLQCPGGVPGCWGRVSQTGTLEPVGPGPQLKLDKVLYQEGGEYRCIVGDRKDLKQWRAALDVRLTVTGAPRVYPMNKTLNALTGQQIVLSVEVCSNPVVSHAVWLTPGVVLRPGDFTTSVAAFNLTEGTSPYCYQAMLMLRNVSPSDEGEYLLVVRSPRGLAEGAITVNVTQASSFSVPTATANHLSSAALSLLVTALTLPQFYMQRTICV